MVRKNSLAVVPHMSGAVKHASNRPTIGSRALVRRSRLPTVTCATAATAPKGMSRLW